MILKGTLLKTASAAVLFLVIAQSCSSDKKPETTSEETTEETLTPQTDKTRFPNDRSELAVLMRNLYDDIKANKDTIAKGGKSDISWSSKYKSMPYATPSEKKNSGPVFVGFATKYLTDLKTFENALPENRTGSFNAMIQTCLDCHQEYCHGPMEAISKLKI